MNEKDKGNIQRLRQQGLGYKKIAQELQLNLNTVKSYCRHHQLQEKDMQSYRCKYCQTTLVQKDKCKKKIFCSNQCRQRWWNTHRNQMGTYKKIILTCANCGKVFKAYVQEQRLYCCHACYIEQRFKQEVLYESK